MKREKGRAVSLKYKLLMVILAVLIPLNVMLITLSQLIVNRVWEELRGTYLNELGIYTTRMEDEIENMDREMKELMSQKWSNLNPSYENYELERYNLWLELKKTRVGQELVDAAYLKTNWDGMTVITHDSVQLNLEEKEKLQTFFEENTMEAYRPFVFQVINISGVFYLVDNVNYFEYSFGLLSKVDSILDSVREMQRFDGEYFYLTDKAGNVVSDEGKSIWKRMKKR